jgi:hypothetical protein
MLIDSLCKSPALQNTAWSSTEVMGSDSEDDTRSASYAPSGNPHADVDFAPATTSNRAASHTSTSTSQSSHSPVSIRSSILASTTQRTDNCQELVTSNMDWSIPSTGPHRSINEFGPCNIKVKCDKPGCRTMVETLQTLRQHNEQAHNRHYHCTEYQCAKSFTTKRALSRHLAKDAFYCPHAQCIYAREGFKRRDYLLKHLHRKHRP